MSTRGAIKGVNFWYTTGISQSVKIWNYNLRAAVKAGNYVGARIHNGA